MLFNAQSAEFPLSIPNARINAPKFPIYKFDKVQIKTFAEKGAGIHNKHNKLFFT